MVLQKQTVSIRDSLRVIKKAPDPLTPVIEAVINSIDSIQERRISDSKFKEAEVDVSWFFVTETTLANEKEFSLDKIQITDNGVGFRQENRNRFMQFANRENNRNNKGTGKIQIFHRFKKILVDSIFLENNKVQHLAFSYDRDDDLSYLNKDAPEKKCELTDHCPLSTTVTLSEFDGSESDLKYLGNLFKEPQLFRETLLSQLILRLFLEKTDGLIIRLKIYENNEEYFSDTLSSEDVPEPDKFETVNINTQKLKKIKQENGQDIPEWEILNSDKELELRRFKLSASMCGENNVYLCAKGFVAEEYKSSVLPKKADFSGFRYLTCVSGIILDENVNHAGNGFVFPAKKEIESQIQQSDLLNPEDIYIFRDEINDKLNEKLKYIHADLLNPNEEKQQEAAEIAKQYGIDLDLSKKIRIKTGDSREDITKKLFAAEANRFASNNIEIRKTYDDLVSLEAGNLDPLSAEYEEKFRETSQKLMQLIPQQNKDELTRYIIRRDMVVRLLKMALRNELNIQKDWSQRKEKDEKLREEQEGLIHDLIFKRKSKNALNDLWILDEEFVHFQGVSDLPLEELEIDNEKLLKDGVEIQKVLDSVGLTLDARLKKRPDIFLYPEEGKCILIEFKAPKVELRKHLDQISQYAKLIANYSKKPIRQFYGFLIGENINKVDVSDRYRPACHGGYWFYPSERIASIETDATIADIYQEIIPLSTIAERASRRNRSFSERLGITREDEGKNRV